MTVKRFLRKATLTRRSHLTVFVLPDETSAFQAYRLLQFHGISPEHLAIVGKGYSNPERVGLLKPWQIAMGKAQRLAIFAAVLGAATGFIFSLALHVSSESFLGPTLFLIAPAVAIVGGFCGAVVGFLFGFLGEGSASGIYLHHLRQGRYLLMIEGSERLVRWGQEVLSHYSAPKSY